MTDTVPMSPNRAVFDRRRRLWVVGTSVYGGAGLLAASVPFFASFAPSDRARALGAPVTLDPAGVGPGELHSVEWRRKPVWVLRRTPAMLDSLNHDAALLADPGSTRSEQPRDTRNTWRSVRPEIAVLVGICTHLGCIPTFRPHPGDPDLGADWPGGFYCPCHGSKFDLAGRVFRNVPAPLNLEVPAYHFDAAGRLVIGTA